MALQHIAESHEKWIINFSRIGIASKGLIYCILGVISILVATGYSNNKINKNEVFKTILEQPFGKILLLVLSFGLLGYVIWCIIVVIKDPYNKGNDWKGIAKRSSYLLSGLIYLSITFVAAKMAWTGSSSGTNENNQQSLIAETLNKPFGQWMVGLVALGIISFGIYQIYLGVTNKFLKHIREENFGSGPGKIYKLAGKLGFISRAIILGVIGFLLAKAALYINPGEAKGTEGAFQFINTTFGPLYFGLIALGLIAYGLFMFVKAKYAEMHF